MEVLVKTFDHYHLKFQLFQLSCNLKLKFRSKFNHGFTNHGYLHCAVWKALYNFKIKRAQGARHNQFFFQNVQNNEIFEIFKMLKNNSWIKLNLVQKLKINSLRWNFVPRLIQICRIPWWCSLFLFSTEITFLGKIDSENKIVSLSWNFA